MTMTLAEKRESKRLLTQVQGVDPNGAEVLMFGVVAIPGALVIRVRYLDTNDSTKTVELPYGPAWVATGASKAVSA